MSTEDIARFRWEEKCYGPELAVDRIGMSERPKSIHSNDGKEGKSARVGWVKVGRGIMIVSHCSWH